MKRRSKENPNHTQYRKLSKTYASKFETHEKGLGKAEPTHLNFGNTNLTISMGKTVQLRYIPSSTDPKVMEISYV
jgi:hypothetical protein